ncbi:transcription factor A, mitochondrial isoform X2 [Polypterus senegalus]|uniref:transcription factor A, mitochondrial isoform X2 n=1 Tax=Polypterus senegalus TaxID=55291 RepID=UPI001963AC84|nr:transcription factor A, mitochondrial isoform X2 [Polypterus senegalus]
MVSLISNGAAFFSKAVGFLSTRSFTRCTCEVMKKVSFSTSSLNPPKRPLTGYLRYAMQKQPILLKQYPALRIVEITKKIAQEWRGMTPDQKKPFLEAASLAREKYKQDIEKFNAQLTPAQAAAFKEEKRQKRVKRKLMRRKRELTVLGKPKRPRSAFNIFMAEHFVEAKGVSLQEKMKGLFNEWVRLNSSQKQGYMRLAEDDKIRYKNEIKSWEDHMIRIGREDLVRKYISTSVKAKHTKRAKTKAKLQKRKTKDRPTTSKKPTLSAARAKRAKKAKKREE